MDQSERNNKESNEDIVLLTRRDKYIIGIAVVVVLIVFFLYLYFFSGGFSNKHNEWGLFGDYFGGTLGPILSFITILILIYTLRIGYKTLTISKQELKKATDMLKLAKEEVEHAKEATEKQVNQLEKDSLKNEIAMILKEIDSDIQQIFQIRFRRNSAYNIGQLVSDESPIDVSTQVSYDQLMDEDIFYIKRLYNLLLDMEGYIKELDMKLGRPLLSYYYKKKYGKAVNILEGYVPVGDEFEPFVILGR